MAETQNTPQQIGINIQYIKDFSFENPNAPQIYTPTSGQPILNVGVNVQSKGIAENTYEVVLMLKLEAKMEDKVAFISDLSYAGIFTIPALPEEALKLFLLAEAPRHLFPFARAIVANAVRDAGFPQAYINPVDFLSLYEANAQQEPAGNA